jgi:hypothetical protein
MKKEEILRAITGLTLKIKEQYPEVYPFLKENPLTFGPVEEELELKSLISYKNTLEELIQNQRQKANAN